jgi:acyl-CoA thioester hydrolase
LRTDHDSPNLAHMDNPIFSWESEVRDYECDLQGIVNNAVYQNYLEHARHLFIKNRGVDFAEVTARGIFLIVVRIEIDYKYPLRSNDRFRVDINLERVTRVRFAFVQEITCLNADKLAVKAKVITAAMDKSGRPMYPKDLESLLPEVYG